LDVSDACATLDDVAVNVMISRYNENPLQSALATCTEISQPFKRSIIFFLNAAERYVPYY